MKRKIRRITIICEGYEEFDYLMCLLHLGLWNEAYTVRIKNAKSLTNIPPVYQSEYQNDNADLIVVLEDGAVVGKGTHHELLRSCKVYREIARSQLSEAEFEAELKQAQPGSARTERSESAQPSSCRVQHSSSKSTHSNRKERHA